eukprot:403349632
MEFEVKKQGPYFRSPAIYYTVVSKRLENPSSQTSKQAKHPELTTQCKPLNPHNPATLPVANLRIRTLRVMTTTSHQTQGDPTAALLTPRLRVSTNLQPYSPRIYNGNAYIQIHEQWRDSIRRLEQMAQFMGLNFNEINLITYLIQHQLIQTRRNNKMTDFTKRYSSLQLNKNQDPLKYLNEVQRKMSFNMNANNVINQKKVENSSVCGLCHAILQDPMQCNKCKTNFHKSCLLIFCKETGKCPMNCENPKFKSLQKKRYQLIKMPLSIMKFANISQLSVKGSKILHQLVDEKALISDCVQNEIYRKNTFARKILDLQRESEVKLSNLLKVLEFDESKIQNNQAGDDVDRVESQIWTDSRDYVQSIDQYCSHEISDRVIQQVLPKVPIELREEFKKAQEVLTEAKLFIKNRQFKKESINSKQCRKNFDDIFDSLRVIADLPLDTQIFHITQKRFLNVEARDFVIFQKIQKVTPYEYFIVHKSVSADTLNYLSQNDKLSRENTENELIHCQINISGFRLKYMTKNRTQVTYFSEMDLKLSKFIQQKVCYKYTDIPKKLKLYMESQTNHTKKSKIQDKDTTDQEYFEESHSEDENQEINEQQALMREQLEKNKKELKELKREIQKIKIKMSDLPEDQRNDMLDSILIQKDSVANDYRFLNKVIDKINVGTYDKKKLQENLKFISDLNQFNLKTNLIKGGRSYRDNTQKVANLESIISRSIQAQSQTSRNRNETLQLKSEIQTENTRNSNSILDIIDEKNETINQIRQKELLMKIKASMQDQMQKLKVRKERNKSYGQVQDRISTGRQSMQSKQDSQTVEKDEYGWPIKSHESRQMTSVSGSMVAFQRGMLSQLKRKQLEMNLLKSQLKRSNDIQKVKDQNYIENQNRFGSLHTSLLDSESSITKNEIKIQEDFIHIENPVNELDFNESRINPAEVIIQEAILQDKDPQQERNWNEKKFTQQQPKQTETQNYCFMKSPPSHMMSKFFKGLKTSRSTQNLKLKEKDKKQKNQMSSNLPDISKHIELKNINYESNLSGQKLIYLQNHLAQAAIPSIFMKKSHSRKQLFSNLAPAIQFSKQNHQKFVKNALKYNQGTLAKVSSEEFLQAFRTLQNTPQQNPKIEQIFSNQIHEVPTTAYTDTFQQQLLHSDMPEQEYLSAKKQTKNQSIGMLKKKSSSTMIPMPMTTRTFSPPFDPNLFHNKKLQEIGTGITNSRNYGQNSSTLNNVTKKQSSLENKINI